MQPEVWMDRLIEAHSFLRGNGGDAIFGLPTSPSIETLRQAWLDASDFAGSGRFAVTYRPKRS